MHNRMVIRRLSMLPICLALLLAFLMAPYQHVHPSRYHGRAASDDDDDSALIHSHFSYVVSLTSTANKGTTVRGSNDDQTEWSLDTFRSLQHSSAVFVFCQQPGIQLPALIESSRTVEFVRGRGHDPPIFESFTPRAPPI
jgi:hypothetical protein